MTIFLEIDNPGGSWSYLIYRFACLCGKLSIIFPFAFRRFRYAVPSGRYCHLDSRLPRNGIFTKHIYFHVKPFSPGFTNASASVMICMFLFKSDRLALLEI